MSKSISMLKSMKAPQRVPVLLSMALQLVLLSSSLVGTKGLNVGPPESSAGCWNRRSWLVSVGGSVASCAVITASLSPSVASALVYTDPDRYGDKELKVALVNKLRQNLRNSITEDPSLAPKFVELAIQDALTYNPTNQQGGPDGSILVSILNDNQLPNLKSAAQALVDVGGKTKRTTEITRGDLISFAGAEAIETMGGPRCAVQIGKLDPSKPYRPAADSLPDLNNPTETVAAFERVGLGPRDVTLLFAAIEAMKQSVEILQASKKGANGDAGDDDEDEFEENEMGDPEVVVPTSFGAPSDIYGKRLGSMEGSKLLAGIVKDLKQKRPPSASIFSDPRVAECANTYAQKKATFNQDLPLAYQRLVAVGQTYTGGKVGSLLGAGENQI